MGDPYAPASAADVRNASAGTAPAAAPLGFLDSIRLGFKEASAGPDGAGVNQTMYEARALGPIRKAWEKAGSPPLPAYSTPVTTQPNYSVQGSAAWQSLQDRGNDALLGWYQQRRRQDPNFLPEFASIADHASLRQWAIAQRQRDLASAQQGLEGGSGVGEFIGQLGTAYRDPYSYIPVAGEEVEGINFGRRLVTTMARQGAVNAGIATVQEPAVGADAAALGIPHTGWDSARDIGIAGLFGTGLGALEAPFAHLSATRRAAAAGTDADRAAAAAAATAVPPDLRTPDEQAALNVVTRAADVAETSPFTATPAGADGHAEALNGWLDAITRAPTPPATALPPVPTPVSRAALLGGTADPASLRFPAREQVKARIAQAESGGNPNAHDPHSSAAGLYGFTASTWNNYFIRRFGRQGLSDAEITAKRGDPAIREVLMNDLLADNGRMLRAAGQPETAGSLYMMHFLGPDGLKVLRAGLDTPLEALLPARDFKANPWLKGKSAGDLVGWADRKMGQPGAPPVRLADAAPDVGAPDAIDVEDMVPDPQIADGPVTMADRSPGDDWQAMGEPPALRPDQFGSAEEAARAQLIVDAERDAHAGLSPTEPAIEAASAPAPARRASSRGPLSLTEFIRARGGLEDVNGDFAAMGAAPLTGIAPKGATKLLRARPDTVPDGLAASPMHAPDATFAAAIDAGYFPHHAGLRLRDGGDYHDLPDLSEFHAAVDSELRGNKLYTPEDFEDVRMRAEKARGKASGDEILYRLDELANAHGMELDLATLDDAARRFERGLSMEEAIGEAVHAGAWRDIGALAEEHGGAHNAGHGSDAFDREAGSGGARPAHEPGAEGTSAPERAQPESAAGARGNLLDQAVDAAEAARSVEEKPFDDPIEGEAAKAQTDSLEHDLRMEAEAGTPEPVQLDENGNPQDLKSLLDHLDDDEKAAAEMRACLAPPKGGEE